MRFLRYAERLSCTRSWKLGDEKAASMPHVILVSSHSRNFGPAGMTAGHGNFGWKQSMPSRLRMATRYQVFSSVAELEAEAEEAADEVAVEAVLDEDALDSFLLARERRVDPEEGVDVEEGAGKGGG